MAPTIPTNGLGAVRQPVAVEPAAAIAERQDISQEYLEQLFSKLRRAGLGIVLTTTALGWMLGLVWELGEWFGHSYLDERIQVGYDDTLRDALLQIFEPDAVSRIFADGSATVTILKP